MLIFWNEAYEAMFVFDSMSAGLLVCNPVFMCEFVGNSKISNVTMMNL